MTPKDFNKLRPFEKWDTWKDQIGTWYCRKCDTQLGDGPRSAGLFRGSSIHCGNCDAELTRRTGGGQNNPFNWILKESLINKDFTIAWSDFALKRHAPRNGFSFSILTNEEVLKSVRENWNKAIPGTGEKDLTRKILVPIPVMPHTFYTSTTLINELTPVSSIVTKRAAEEDLYIQNYTSVMACKPEPANFVKIVCYSADALTENGGKRSSDCDWEIVAIIASPVENEPMHPLVMARNMLEKTGGTKSVYTAEEFAEAVYYWSQRIQIKEE